MKPTTTYILTLTAEGAGPPGEVRLRRALKVMLSCFGLRCIAVDEVKAAKAATSGIIDPLGSRSDFADDDPDDFTTPTPPDQQRPRLTFLAPRNPAPRALFSGDLQESRSDF
jgi:hypothetical protein